MSRALPLREIPQKQSARPAKLNGNGIILYCGKKKNNAAHRINPANNSAGGITFGFLIEFCIFIDFYIFQPKFERAV